MSAQALSNAHHTEELSLKAQACLEQAVEVPSAPLFHMGNIAVFNSKSSFDLIQATIDYLACKAKVKMPFNNVEKTFLIELYESFWWGGYAKRMPEAGRLANHYVHGSGVTFSMDSMPYETSMIVQDVINAMKAYIKELAERNDYFFTLKSDDPKFRRSEHFKPLMLINNSRNRHTQGYVHSSGLIYAEDNNERLQKADNRFYLIANSHKETQDRFRTQWSVANRYDFEPFFKDDKFTDLVFGNGKILLLPDGLSEYMDSGLNIAKPFDYSATWSEVWT